MASNVLMPKMGYDMEEGKILRWLKAEGDSVAKGEPVAEIETDKVAIEIEAFAAGVLSKILAAEGESVPVGEAIAIIGEPGEKVEAPAPRGAATASGGPLGDDAAPVRGPAPQHEQGAGEAGEATSIQQAERKDERLATTPAALQAPRWEEQAPQPAPSSSSSSGERVKASPLAKKIAAEQGLDLARVAGTGPGGRIMKKDLEGAKPAAVPAAAPAAQASAAAPAGEGRREPLTAMRKAIARKMVEAKAPVPHFQVTMDVDMEAAMALRAQINEGLAKEDRISVNDLVVKAAAIALRKHPSLNAQFQGDAIFHPDRVSISVAVATPNGLIAPDIHDADKLSLGTISKQTKDKAGRARDGKLGPDEYGRGTFTVSNLGMYGVEEFTAIITLPQSAAMAVGGARQEPVVKDGQIVPGTRMKFTVSADHRITDGAGNAEFCVEVKNLLENPMRLLL